MINSTDPILKIEGLHLGFGGAEVLRGVDLLVPKDGITAMIGSNGAGKTALLNTISGIYRPQGGRILLDGEPIQDLPAQSVARKGVGRSFQHQELFERLDVTENILVARDRFFPEFSTGIFWFGPAARRRESENRRKVEEVLEFFELGPARSSMAKSLSFGQQKIVGLARALALEPKIILLDEPASGLTRDEKGDLARFLLRIRNELSIPILWIEHDLDMIFDLADKVCALELGVCIASGSADMIRNDPAVISSYLGTSH
ncbi:MAG: ABC transporter ATP-binding protein [Alphaproteobacteria bacterium]